MDGLKILIIQPGADVTDAQAVRKKVFQEGQGIASTDDFDGLDNTSSHVVVYKNNDPIGTARIRFSEDKTKAKIQRVAVLESYQGQGIGRKIMEAVDTYLLKEHILEAYLDAQLQVKEFYEKLGYMQVGEQFEEVGIPHVKMVKMFNMS